MAQTLPSLPLLRDGATWNANQLALMAWLALPTSVREPAQQKDLAGLLGVREATLCGWKKLPGFMVATNALALDLVKDDVADVIATIRRKAKAGDIHFVNLFLAMAGLSGPLADANPSGIMFIEAVRPDGA